MTTKKTIPGRDGVKGQDDLIPEATIRDLEWVDDGQGRFVAGPWHVECRVSLWMAFSPFEDAALCTVRSREAAFEIAQADYDRRISDAIVAVRKTAYPQVQDRFVTVGFPEGWAVEDRPSEKTAVLMAPSSWQGIVSFGRAVCLRPACMTTEEWLPSARTIADKMSRIGSRTTGFRARGQQAVIRPLAWLGKVADYRPDRMVFTATGMGKTFEVVQNDNGSWGADGRFGTAEEAMMALQKEYEEPIRSAMENPEHVVSRIELDVSFA